MSKCSKEFEKETSYTYRNNSCTFSPHITLVEMKGNILLELKNVTVFLMRRCGIQLCQNCTYETKHSSCPPDVNLYNPPRLPN